MTDTSLDDAMAHLGEKAAASIGAMPRLWQCPKCGAEVTALAVAVGHRCPSDRLRWRSFVPVDD